MARKEIEGGRNLQVTYVMATPLDHHWGVFELPAFELLTEGGMISVEMGESYANHEP